MVQRDPRIERIENERARLEAWCAERAHAVRLLNVSGNPPSRYVLRLDCQSVAELRVSQPVLASSQTLEIILPSRYPFQGPTVMVTTKVVHPNIWTSGQVCLGHYWSPQRSLDQLAGMMWRILVWDPEVTNPDSAANGMAAQWYRLNRDKAPFDRLDPMAPKPEKPAASPESAPERIVWGKPAATTAEEV